MKKSTKRMLIFALILFMMGGAFGIASICMGFRSDDFHAVMEDGRFDFSKASKWGKQISSFFGGAAAGKTEFDERYSEIESLDLEIGAADCTIIPSDTGEWRVSGNKLPDGFQCVQQGDKLVINCNSSFINFFGVGTSNAELTIEIPDSQLLKEVRIDMGVGDLSGDAGMIRCEKMDIDSGVGDCELWADVTETITIDGGIGDISLKLYGEEEDFNYDIDCGIGSIDIGEKRYDSLGAEAKTDHGAEKKVKIDSGIGSVKVWFEK